MRTSAEGRRGIAHTARAVYMCACACAYTLYMRAHARICQAADPGSASRRGRRRRRRGMNVSGHNGTRAAAVVGLLPRDSTLATEVAQGGPRARGVRHGRGQRIHTRRVSTRTRNVQCAIFDFDMPSGILQLPPFVVRTPDSNSFSLRGARGWPDADADSIAYARAPSHCPACVAAESMHLKRRRRSHSSS